MEKMVKNWVCHVFQINRKFTTSFVHFHGSQLTISFISLEIKSLWKKRKQQIIPIDMLINKIESMKWQRKKIVNVSKLTVHRRENIKTLPLFHFKENISTEIKKNRDFLVNSSWFQLCDAAQKWANYLAAMNEFYYRPSKTLGQNLFCCPCSALVTDLTGNIFHTSQKSTKIVAKK